jgi:hypothetical protein
LSFLISPENLGGAASFYCFIAPFDEVLICIVSLFGLLYCMIPPAFGIVPDFDDPAA